MKKIRRCLGRCANRHAGIIIGLLILMVVVLLVIFCFRNYAELTQTDLATIVVTIIIALITGGFALYQFIVLGQKKKIKIYSLYNFISSSLINHVDEAGKLVNQIDKYGMHYISISAKERKIAIEKEMEMIYELEELLYVYGKNHDGSKYFKRVIDITNLFRELILSVITIYNILGEGKNLNAKDKAKIRKVLEHDKGLKVIFDKKYKKIIKKNILV